MIFVCRQSLSLLGHIFLPFSLNYCLRCNLAIFLWAYALVSGHVILASHHIGLGGHHALRKGIKWHWSALGPRLGFDGSSFDALVLQQFLAVSVSLENEFLILLFDGRLGSLCEIRLGCNGFWQYCAVLCFAVE